MIKVNELRIGNWVILAAKNLERVFVQVYSLEPTYGINELDPEWFQPIPLTVEILEKVGFVNGVLPIKNIGSITSANNGTDIAFTVNDLWTASRWFQSMHQLQNLYFAVAGEELKIIMNVETN